MKVNIWIAVGALAAVVAIEEARLRAARSPLPAPGIAESAPGSPTSGPGQAPTDLEANVRPPKTPRPEADENPESSEDSKEGFGKALRKMSENPVTRSMMAQGVKAMAATWYADLIDKFQLSDEEAEYFLGLKSEMLAGQQQLAMKLMGAEDEEERQTIMDEIKSLETKNEDEIKAFLNDDGDFATFQAYEKQLPERQQLDGLRTAFADTAPLDPGQEDALVEAMYRGRSQHKGTDWNGAEGMQALASPDAKDRFEQDWNAQNENITREVSGVLSEDQMKAFQTYREQVKEMQLMGIEMASKMFAKPE